MKPLDLILFSLVATPLITAVYVCIQWPGMILHPLLPYLERYVPVWLHKPIFDCIICMASTYTVILWFAFGNGLSLWLLVQVLVVAGFNLIPTYIINQLTDNDHGQPM